MFFKGLFAALTSQYLETNTSHSMEPETLSSGEPEIIYSETPWSLFYIQNLLIKYIFSLQTTSKADLTDVSLSKEAIKSLSITVNSGEKLESLRKWIKTPK